VMMTKEQRIELLSSIVAMLVEEAILADQVEEFARDLAANEALAARRCFQVREAGFATSSLTVWYS
jgi:hypothetical protein